MVIGRVVQLSNPVSNAGTPMLTEATVRSLTEGAGGRVSYRPAHTARRLRVLDLFSGMNGWGDPWRNRGHEVVGIEWDRKFDATYYLDIGDTLAVISTLTDAGFRPDVILASPPCTSFSMMSVGKHWTKDGHPKSETGRQGERLVKATLEIIDYFAPKVWVIENPRARLRSLPYLAGIPRHTVWYCQYGERRAKPTDLWGKFPSGWSPRPQCRNGGPDHIRAPRGSRSGTQGGVDTARAGMIPYQLSMEICLATEVALCSQQ